MGHWYFLLMFALWEFSNRSSTLSSVPGNEPPLHLHLSHDCSSNKCIHTWESSITINYSLVPTCCSTLGDAGCSGFPVCQPCLSQHHYQRGISSARFWIWGLPLVSIQKHYICFYMSIFIEQSCNKVWPFNLDPKDHNKLSVCFLFVL